MLITSVLTLSGFYPRHPRGWRLEGNTLPVIITIVSIHATLAGGDVIATRFKWCLNAFLSTPPSRVATPFLMVKSLNKMFLSTPPSRVATFSSYNFYR